MAAQQFEVCLDRLCESAGKEAEAPLRLLQKLLSNIKSNPSEVKFRRIQTNGRLQKELLCYKGAGAFLKAAGFAPHPSEKDVVEFSPSNAVALSDALLALDRRTAGFSEKKQRDAINADAEQAGEMYRTCVEGGKKMTKGRAAMEALARTAEGQEALKVLEKVLSNLYRFPTTDQYKSVNLSKGAGAKLRPAMDLLKIAGFEVKSDGGDERAVINTVNLDVTQRLTAMVQWAIDPKAVAVTLPAPSSPSVGCALGALLGVAVGDALGAPLEMTGRSPLGADEVDRAMEMCGGGHWGVGPGQVTEDTELMICLADSLAKVGAAAGYPANDASFQYSQWYTTQHFDVGPPIKNAFRLSGSASDMERRSLTCNKDNQGNAALTRAVPLGVWGAGRKLNVEQLVDAARADAKLSHPNITIAYANAVYVLAVAELIRSAGKRDDALRSVTSWVEAESKKGNDLGGVDSWLQRAVNEPYQDLSAAFGPDIGLAEWGFVHAFRHLKLGSSFEYAMRATLAGGGDTDGNAAIVGGLIGASCGIQGIPERWLRPVLVGEGTGERTRPKEFHPERLPKLAEELSAAIA